MDEVRFPGTAGHELVVEAPDTDGDVAFCMESYDTELSAYLDEDARIKLVHFLLAHTAVPGVTLHGRS